MYGIEGKKKGTKRKIYNKELEITICITETDYQIAMAYFCFEGNSVGLFQFETTTPSEMLGLLMHWKFWFLTVCNQVKKTPFINMFAF